jgi:hypothetical protein
MDETSLYKHSLSLRIYETGRRAGAHHTKPVLFLAWLFVGHPSLHPPERILLTADNQRNIDIRWHALTHSIPTDFLNEFD